MFICSSDGLGPQNLVFEHLSIRDLFRLSQTCRTIRTKILQTCYSIYSVLAPFFGTREEIDMFRRVQEVTGTLISGSTALRLFLRTAPSAPDILSSAFPWAQSEINPVYRLKEVDGKDQYTNTDLDIYVDHRYAREVARFLQEDAGYTFHPREAQWQTWQEQLSLASSDERRTNNPDTTYLGRGIADVLDWYREAEEDEPMPLSDVRGNASQPLIRKERKKIQLITAKRSPMDVILTYHSSVLPS